SYISALVVAAVVSLAAFTSGCTTITTERAKAPLFDGAGGGFGSRPAGVEGPLKWKAGDFSLTRSEPKGPAHSRLFPRQSPGQKRSAGHSILGVVRCLRWRDETTMNPTL